MRRWCTRCARRLPKLDEVGSGRQVLHWWQSQALKYPVRRAKTFGSNLVDTGYAVRTDRRGNVFLTGYFQGTVNFGGATLTSTGWTDMFTLSVGP